MPACCVLAVGSMDMTKAWSLPLATLWYTGAVGNNAGCAGGLIASTTESRLGRVRQEKGSKGPGCEWELMVESPKRPTGREGTHTTAICAR